jgi:hypothetical protein
MTPLEASDVDEILEMFRAGHEESAMYGQLPWDEAIIRGRIQSMIAAPSVHVGYIRGKGVQIGMVQEHWTGLIRVGVGIVWYVRPEYRKGTTAIRLLESWHRFCEDSKVALTYGGDSAGIDPANTLSVLSRMGYEPSATVLQRRFDYAN